MENLKLIQKIAWMFYKTTHIEFDDLFQEAAIAYLTSQNKYNSTRGKTTTFSWWCIKNHLVNYVKIQNAYRYPRLFIEDLKFDKPVNTSYFFENLSKPAEQIAVLINENSKELLSCNPKKAKRKINSILYQKGFSMRNIHIGMRELQISLNN